MTIEEYVGPVKGGTIATVSTAELAEAFEKFIAGGAIVEGWDHAATGPSRYAWNEETQSVELREVDP